jgi:hypothetical protein
MAHMHGLPQHNIDKLFANTDANVSDGRHNDSKNLYAPRMKNLPCRESLIFLTGLPSNRKDLSDAGHY